MEGEKEIEQLVGTESRRLRAAGTGGRAAAREEGGRGRGRDDFISRRLFTAS